MKPQRPVRQERQNPRTFEVDGCGKDALSAVELRLVLGHVHCNHTQSLRQGLEEEIEEGVDIRINGRLLVSITQRREHAEVEQEHERQQHQGFTRPRHTVREQAVITSTLSEKAWQSQATAVCVLSIHGIVL